MDRGDTWTATIDLTKHIDRNTLPIMGVPGKDPMASKHDGYTGYGYVVTVAESPWSCSRRMAKIVVESILCAVTRCSGHSFQFEVRLS